MQIINYRHSLDIHQIKNMDRILTGNQADKALRPHQPLSLLTINADPSETETSIDDKEDPLAVRVLEASERKLQLIKRLLTPEEFDSIRSNLIYAVAAPQVDQSLAIQEQQPTIVGSKQSGGNQDGGGIESTQADLPDESRTGLSISTVRDNLEKKQEADEFFHQPAAPRQIVQQKDLTLELKSGYYRVSAIEDRTYLVLDDLAFNPFERLISLFEYLGLSFTQNLTQIEQQFIERHNTLFVSPYAKARNLLLMRNRLERDGQLDKLLTLTDKDHEKLECLDSDRSIVDERYIPKPIPDGGNRCSTRISTIRLTHAKKSDLLEPVKLLNYRPFIDVVTSMNRRKCNLTTLINENQFSTSDSYEIKLISLVLKNHASMLKEEVLVVELLEMSTGLAELEKDISCKLEQIAGELVSVQVRGIESISKIEKLLETRSKLIYQLSNSQQRVISTYKDIESAREQQNFSSTPIKLTTVDLDSEQAWRKSIAKFIQHSSSGEEQHGADILAQVCRSLTNGSVAKEVQITFDHPDFKNAPAEHGERRMQLRRWLAGLEIQILKGNRYYYNCKRGTADLEVQDYLYKVDLGGNNLIIPSESYEKRPFELQFNMYERRMKFTSWFQKLVANMQIDLNETNSQFRSVNLNFSDGITVARLTFHATRRSTGNQKNYSKYRHADLINSACEKLFEINHPFDTSEMKLSRLMNQADTRLLMQWFLGEQSKLKFALEPLVDRFELQDAQAEVRYPTRHQLLIWRWINDVNQLIYLNDRDNFKNLTPHLEEIESKLRLIPHKLETGYRQIEQIRSLALDAIKKFELSLKRALDSTTRPHDQMHANQRMNQDLLVEPQFKVDLTVVTRAALKFLPRRRAHRPLRPQRSITKSTGFDHELTSSHQLDLENQVIDQWHRFAAQKASDLRLVVTIQQATNVPMRVVHPSSTRLGPDSPFVSGPSLEFTGTNYSLFNLQSKASYLGSPTTYVEIVSQRRHKTSSLAFGKNPCWNETIFFPIELASHNSFGASVFEDRDMSHSQLLDEFLQVNLFDYRCYAQNSVDGNSLGELPTLAFESDPSSVVDSTLQPTRLLASQQRIERHLLGSLKIPIATLLSNGRLEGSFRLNQPLFLDDYQFEPQQALDFRTRLGVQSPDLFDHLETHLSLFITLDPPITVSNFNLYLPTGSIEPEPIFEYTKLWEQLCLRNGCRIRVSPMTRQQSRPKTSQTKQRRTKPPLRFRHLRALALQDEGKYYLLCRLLTPMEIPKPLIEGSSDIKDQMASVARFVSLLSPIKYGILNLRRLAPSLWFNSKQLIEQNLGGPEEKAVLLCNYFLSLNKCSAILLGDAIPDGRCVYVIVWSDQSLSPGNQLQLQATTLMESINSISGTTQASGSLINRGYIDQENFVSELPILIAANSIQLWDPNSGRAYSMKDRLQLTSVGSIVTVENVYANVQTVEKPADTNFDIRQKQLWFPLFDASVSPSTFSVLKRIDRKKDNHAKWSNLLNRYETLRRSIGRPIISPILSNSLGIDYLKFDEHQTEELRSKIEKSIKGQLIKWRPNRPTYFNRTLSRLLSDKLALFESYLTKSHEKRVNWRSELANLIKNEVLVAHSSSRSNNGQIVSWPANLPYTTMKTILDSLYASGVQNADLALDSDELSVSNTQFLVSCHVHPYPARVMSAWIYVAAMITVPKDRKKLLVA